MTNKPDEKTTTPPQPGVTTYSSDDPGKTTSDQKPTDAGAGATPPEDGSPGGDGPSASSKPGPHGLPDASEALPGQPVPDDASSAEEVRVRDHGQKTVKE